MAPKLRAKNQVFNVGQANLCLTRGEGKFVQKPVES
jgi:hypothetical protein